MSSRESVVLNGVTAAGDGNAILVADFDHIVIHLDFEDTPTATVKAKGSAQKGDVPDFSAAQANDNRWDFVEMVDLEDGSSIAGDDGVSVAGSADHRVLEVNVNHLEWFSLDVESYTAGTIYARVTGKRTEE